MSETEKRYVKTITDADKQKIIDSSVEALSNRPTSNATEMKMRFVAPIVNTSGVPCLADEVDRIANEANDEFAKLNKQADKFSEDIENLKKENGEQSEAIGATNSAIARVEEKVTEDIADIREVANRAEGMAYNAETGLSVVYNESADKIVASIDNSTFVMTIKLFDRQNNEMSSTQIDLPLESMVVDAEYRSAAGGAILLKLQSGSAIVIPVADIVRGLISDSEKGAPNGIATLDENGKVPAEQLPEGSGGGIDDEALKDYVKFTDYATASKAGVFKTDNSVWSGLRMASDNVLKIECATEAEIEAKTQVYKPIVPKYIPKAIKVGITTNTETWTDEDKAAACETIGAVNKAYFEEIIASLQAQINALK